MPPKGSKVVVSNRRARHDYDILETYEAGLVLTGSEVKALRTAQAQLADAYAAERGGELWLHGAHIAPYSHASGASGHEPMRPRKLLLHRAEIDEIVDRLNREHLTVVPLALYFRDGKAKAELALARGRKKHDKRQAIAARDAAREAERAFARHQRGQD